MNYLSVESLSKAYGQKILFNKISFGINQGQKVALVAKNGAGKTSLLNIIAGKDTADSGLCTLRRDIRVAFLPQDPRFDPEMTAVEVLFSGEDEVAKTIREYEKCTSDTSMDEAGINRMQALQEKMDELKAWDYEARARQVLSKLGLEKHLEQKTSTLSGGQKKRLALAQILIQEPDLMILDEPTNHLDIEMTEWLENYLNGKDLTLLIVTHDRYFLDRICNEIIELDGGNVYRYKGNYSYYVEKKAERELLEASELEKAKNLYRRELEWVRKMPRARGTKAKARVDAFEDVKENAFKKKNTDKVEISVKMNRLGGKILELIKLKKAFGDKKILNDFSYVFKKGEKIGIVGKNGVGKSTFLNMILGLEAADSGKIQTGETIVYGYYSQAGIDISGEKRVIEVIRDIAEFIPMADGSKLTASMLLQRFLFTPETQYGFVEKLSGGEKRRLYLLTILMKNPNFLILDEPTNDLDIQTLSILEEFLADFPGCVLIVTHDRYFMDRLVDHLFIFEGEGAVRDFPGNYTQYRDKLEEEEKSGKNVEKSSSSSEKILSQVQSQTPETPAEKRKIGYKEKFEYEQLGKEIPNLEARKKELEVKMNSGLTGHDELQKLSREYELLGKELDEKSLRWLELEELVNG